MKLIIYLLLEERERDSSIPVNHRKQTFLVHCLFIVCVLFCFRLFVLVQKPKAFARKVAPSTVPCSPCPIPICLVFSFMSTLKNICYEEAALKLMDGLTSRSTGLSALLRCLLSGFPSYNLTFLILLCRSSAPFEILTFPTVFRVPPRW